MSDENAADLSENMKVLLRKCLLIISKESVVKGLNFKPRPSDVLIVTYPKSGTTWMQQIVHQLRTGGDMEFSDIHEVVPFIETAHDVHMDLEADQLGNFRSFKTHYWYDICPKGGKYILIYREPCAAAYSFFKYLEGWLCQPGEIQLEEFVTKLWLNSEILNVPYFKHLLSWWKHRDDPNVLFLFFEDMKEDLEKVVKIVASFIGINDQESIQNAVRMSSFDFMKANSTKFDENILSRYRNHICGVPEGIVGSRVVTGSAELASRVMPEHVKKYIQEEWVKILTSGTGYQTYDELRIGFRKERPLDKLLEI